MAKKIIFKAGEATVFASEGQYTDAMPEILIGDVSGPVGQAFANMMAQSKGHTCMFAVRACNHMVRPATMMATKVTIKDEAYVNLFGGVVQSAVADAIVDCVAEKIIPATQANNLCILALIWIDPRAPHDPNLDKEELFKNNYEATKLAVRRAMKDEPTVKQLIASRKKVKHDMFDQSTGKWY
jgi:5,6,7,8-tetrahydromethanopterin hydro-lyase